MMLLIKIVSCKNKEYKEQPSLALKSIWLSDGFIFES